MPVLLLKLFLPSALAICGVTQETVDVAERIRLRELLRVPAATQITFHPKAKLPTANPLKVHLGFGLDFEVRNNFARWIEQWNDKQGARFGQLEIVDELQQAQVILARFADSDLTINLTILESLPIARSGNLPSVKQEKRTPIYYYIILPTGADLQVIRRGQFEQQSVTHPATELEAGQQLRHLLFALLKRRGQAR